MSVSLLQKPALYSKGIPVDIDQHLHTLLVDGSMKDAANGVWILKNKHRWSLDILTDSKSTVLSVVDSKPDSSLYARALVPVSFEDGQYLSVRASVNSTHAESCTFTASLYRDVSLSDQIESISQSLAEIGEIRLRSNASNSAKFWLLLQIDFPATKFTASEFMIRTWINDIDNQFEQKKFNFQTFGSRTKASSRLRSWMIADEFKNAGHQVTINVPKEADIYFFQKVRPFAMVEQIPNRDNKILVFDFDDNYFLSDRGNVREFIAFINHMDLITVGSAYLQKIAEKYHPNVVLLDNPADIDLSRKFKTPTTKCKKIGWFGGPDNINQLEKIDYDGDITTVTRGGHIEYDQNTIDETLIEFDLLLFPLEIDEWTAAKNANRMVKAAALGIPVLASATPEHLRAAELMGMQDTYLVHEEETWSNKISEIIRNYGHVYEEFSVIRKKTLSAYDPSKISRSLFESIHEVGKRKQHKLKASSKQLGNTDIIIVSALNAKHGFDDFFENCEIDLDCFSSTVVFDSRLCKNTVMNYGSSLQAIREKNPLLVYEKLDEYISSTSADHILLTNDSVILLKPILESIEFEYDVLGLDTSSIGSPSSDTPANHLDAYRVLKDLNYPEVMLINTEWLRNTGLLAAEFLSWFPLAIWMEALMSNQSRNSISPFPVGFTRLSSVPQNMSILYAKYLVDKDSSMKDNIPNSANQWCRLQHDFAHTILQRHSEFSPAIAARLLQLHFAELAKRSA